MVAPAGHTSFQQWYQDLVCPLRSCVIVAFHSFHRLTLKDWSSSIPFRNPAGQNQLNRGEASYLTFPTVCLFFCSVGVYGHVHVCAPQAVCEVKREGKGFPPPATTYTHTHTHIQLGWIKCSIKGWGAHATSFSLDSWQDHSHTLAHILRWLSRLPVSTSCFCSHGWTTALLLHCTKWGQITSKLSQQRVERPQNIVDRGLILKSKVIFLTLSLQCVSEKPTFLEDLKNKHHSMGNVMKF